MTDDPSRLKLLPPGDWAALLAPDEHLLWEGAPARGLRFSWPDLGKAAGGILILAFYLHLAKNLFFPTPDLTITSLDLIVLLVIIMLNFSVFLYSMLQRAKAVYALTDQRALIAQSLFGRTLKSYNMGPNTVIDVRPGPETSIYFAKETISGSNNSDRTDRVGFEFLREGERVYRLMCAVQKGEAVVGDPA